MAKKDWIDTAGLTLAEWLKLVYNPFLDDSLIRHSFPSGELLNEYIATVQSRSHEEVERLLLFLLIEATSYSHDENRFRALMNWRKANDKIFKDLMSHTYYKRLWVYFKRNKDTLPWEGNTWTLDLLPHSPKAALEVLKAYISVHMFISDHVVEGLFDAMAIIRAKYIGLPGTQSEKVAMLLDLSSRQFEHLTERLYYYMEYNTWLTAPTRDGGRDIIAKINDGAKREFLLVESKRYTGTVGVKRIRELYGVVNAEKANRGVLVTSGKFTRDAKKFADSNSIQLIDGDMFVRLLNEHLGADWAQKLDRFIAESELHYQARGLGDAVWQVGNTAQQSGI